MQCSALRYSKGGASGFSAIAGRLSDRFHLLTGGDQIAVRRQQTLRTSIDWSYDLFSSTIGIQPYRASRRGFMPAGG